MKITVFISLFYLALSGFLFTGCGTEEFGASTNLDVNFQSDDSSINAGVDGFGGADADGGGGADADADGGPADSGAADGGGGVDGVADGPADSGAADGGGGVDGVADGPADSGPADGGGGVDGVADGPADGGGPDDPAVCHYQTGYKVKAMAKKVGNTSGVARIVVTISKIRFHPQSGHWIDRTLNKTVDLLALGRNGAGPSSGIDVPQGIYKKIRLYFSCAEIHFNDGAIEPLKIVANSSIQLLFNPRLDLNGVTDDEINITFDPLSGLKWNGGQGWMLAPTSLHLN